MEKLNVHSIVETAAEIGGPKKQATEMTVMSLQDCCKSVIEKHCLKRVDKASIPSSSGPKKETYAGAAKFLMPAEKAAPVSPMGAFNAAFHLASDMKMCLIPQKNLEHFQIRKKSP
ncbi:uncharacterized protein [Drosophila pseudoobscura]|uniref:Uncharacterized protein n=1 Tax=Drosophila pseudoobscura pseudoobscura TaxID=46245 RepID=A0A6I8V1J0_DROPS|nr:uncharacterized protein LOC6900239 [Drosophila pseudoobscura]